MDKHEYREMTEEMLAYAASGSYREAMAVANRIDWRKVKNVPMLCSVSEIYESNKEYEKSRDILFLAYDRSPESKKIIYRLAALALKLGEVKEAMDCYDEFVTIAPKDPNRFILQYKILKAKHAPIGEQIEVLEKFKQSEYVEKWAYELARLYDKAGMTSECVEECDDLILWFNEGDYVFKAMDLKRRYKPLSPLQQEKYDLRYKPVDIAGQPIVEEKKTVAEVFEEARKIEEPIQEQETTVAEETVAEEQSDTPSLSIEELLQDWEATQEENKKKIDAEIQKVELEKSREEAEAEEIEAEPAEEILPDDVRQLMEELETEEEVIEAQKIVSDEEPQAVAKEEPKEETDLKTNIINALKKELPILDTFAPVEQTAEVSELVVGDLTAEPAVEHVSDEIKLGDTQSMAAVAKALKNHVEVEIPENEIVAAEEEVAAEVGNTPYDTGFIVQGRYDLEAQSEVGLKAGLTEEQKKLFSYFVPVHGMSEQLVEVLNNDQMCKSRYGTSRIGNVLIIGRQGSGKTVLAVDVVKAIQKARGLKQGKVGIVTAEALNKKNPEGIFSKLFGGAVIIERASGLNKNTVDILCELMEGQTGELLVVMEDERKPLEGMLALYPQFAKKFTSRLELPVFINDELVTFGQIYAKENGYNIDEMGILALYTRIDMLQRDEKVITVADVKEIVDEAIDNAHKTSFKKMFDKVLGKDKDDADRILLKEEDFK